MVERVQNFYAIACTSILTTGESWVTLWHEGGFLFRGKNRRNAEVRGAARQTGAAIMGNGNVDRLA